MKLQIVFLGLLAIFSSTRSAFYPPVEVVDHPRDCGEFIILIFACFMFI